MQNLRLAAAAFLLMFGSLSAAAGGVVRANDNLIYARALPPSEQLPPGRWYVDYGVGTNSFAHTLLYFGFGESIPNARRADILIVGNSRAQFAFRFPVMNEFADRHNLRYFNLAMAHTETDTFALRVMQRHDLRPKLVVANADGFFTGVPSSRGELEMQPTRFGTWRRGIEGGGEYLFRMYLRPLVPRFLPRIPPPIGPAGRRENSLILRSTVHGSWFVWGRPDERIPVQDGGAEALKDRDLRAAVSFRDAVREGGGELVLTLVPSSRPLGSRTRARALAEHLGVPFISPHLAGLVTEDGSHLNMESAARFATAFLEELEQIPAFQGLETGDPFPSPADQAAF